jgi:hypothetical protein
MAIWVREGSLGTGSGSSFANARSFYDIGRTNERNPEQPNSDPG